MATGGGFRYQPTCPNSGIGWFPEVNQICTGEALSDKELETDILGLKAVPSFFFFLSHSHFGQVIYILLTRVSFYLKYR